MLRAYQQLKNIYHFFQAHAWRVWYGMPDKGLKLYGVTGTNGKTTTSILIASMLQEQFGKEKVGLLTTIVFWIGGEETVNETKMTTMKSRDMFRYLRDMKKMGVIHVVLEVTSHALDQHRLAGIQLEGAVIMNIQREHLDYHKTMEEYAKAKMQIIDYLRPQVPLVIKGDDEWIQQAVASSTYQVASIPIVKFTSVEAQSVQTPLIGETNKENVLAATKLAKAVGVSGDAIKRAVAKVDHVPGRMEWVRFPPDKGGKGGSSSGVQTPSSSPLSGGEPRVLIDYAVTPDALERLYDYVHSQTSGKIFAVLGAAGLRDRGKRADMARVVAERADELILTREDPWTENEAQIFGDLEKGLTHPNPPPHLVRGKLLSGRELTWRRIPDRREAIRYCLEKGKAGDVIVVTGKGAETGMGVGKKILPWSDRKVILELLEQLQNDQ